MKRWLAFPLLLRLGGRRTSFKVGVIATLAIAVGANIAVLGNLGVLFGRVVPGAAHGILLSPYLQASQQTLPLSMLGIPRTIYDRFAKLMSGSGTLAAFQTYRGGSLQKGSVKSGINFVKTTPSLASVLGVHTVVGRLFNAGDSQAGAAKVALVSHALARRRFGSAEAALNREITLGGTSRRIVGVLPSGLVFPPDNPGEAWVPMPPEKPAQEGTQLSMNLYFHSLHVLLRPAPGLSKAHIKAALARAQAQYAGTMPAAEAPMFKAMGFEPQVKTYARRLYGLTITKLELLEIAALLLVLLVLANLVGLATADTLARRHEFAARAALGARAPRLYLERARELLTLGLIGWAIGVWLGWLASRALSATIGHAGVHVALSTPVLLMTVAAVVIVMLLLALGGVRRLHAPRNLLSDLMSGGRATGGKALVRTLRALIVVQLAASVVLLIVAGHFQANIANLSRSNLGFDPAHLSFVHLSQSGAILLASGHKSEHPSGPSGETVMVTMGTNGLSKSTQKMHATTQEIISRLRAAPGVNAVAAVSTVPLSGQEALTVPVGAGGRSLTQAQWKQLGSQAVSSEVVKTLGLSVVAGDPDAIFHGASHAVFIDERSAQTLFPQLTPAQVIGKSLQFEMTSLPGKKPKEYRVDAVVRNLKVNPYLPSEGQVYKAFDTGLLPFAPTLAVRSRLHGQALRTLVGNVVKQVYPQGLPVRVKSANSLIAKAYAKRTRLGRVFGVLAVVALLIAAIGLFALLAYRSLTRRPEFAIRGALGATPGRLLGNVLGEAGALWIVGCVIGVPAAYGLSVVLASYLPKLGLPAAWVTVAVVVAMGIAALVAAFVPARRAAGTDLSRNLSA